MNTKEIQEVVNKNDINILEEHVKKRNETLKKIKRDHLYSFKTSNDLHYLINNVKIIKKSENEVLTKDFIEDINRFLKFETANEVGLICVNPYIRIPTDKLSAQERKKGFSKNVIVVTDILFQEIINYNFNIKTFEEQKASDNIENILASAIERGATDIYINISDGIGKIQFRIDETIIDQKEKLNKEQSKTIRISLAENANQDSKKVGEIKGKITKIIKGQKKEFRLSILQHETGYQIVIRVLAEVNKDLTLAKLGYEKEHIPIIQKMFFGRGLILMAGATGSGKTTTLAVVMRDYYAKTNAKIMTMEDPVEIKNQDFVQVLMNSDAEEKYQTTFAKTIATCLRQKPDMLMVGEIRNEESAIACVNAALSGHTTVSTVHSNSAKSTVSRLLKLGLTTTDLNDTFSGVIAQRLIPKLCSCKLEDKEATEQFKRENNINEDFILYKRNPEGCMKCRLSKAGIKGKSIIYEIAAFKNNYEGNYSPIEESTKEFIPMIETAKIKLKKGEIDFETYKTLEEQII